MRDAALLREAFAALGVGRMASAEQVRAAWKRKLKTAHPDVGGTKEAVQYATNMRDVVIAWIEAGRPDLDAQPDPAWAYTSRRSRTQDFAWQDVTPPGAAEALRPQPTTFWHGFWAVAAIWGLSLMVAVLSDSPRKESRPIGTHQSHFWSPCITEALREFVQTKCRPARSLTDYPEFAKAPPDLPTCTDFEIMSLETKAMIEGRCFPPWWVAAQTRTSGGGVPPQHSEPALRQPGAGRDAVPSSR